MKKFLKLSEILIMFQKIVNPRQLLKLLILKKRLKKTRKRLIQLIGNIDHIPDEGPSLEDGTEPVPTPAYSSTELTINPDYTNPRCNDILEINGDTLCAGSVTDSPFGASVILNLSKLNSDWEYKVTHGAFKKLIKISDELILAYRERMDFHRPSKSIGKLYLINPNTENLLANLKQWDQVKYA